MKHLLHFIILLALAICLMSCRTQLVPAESVRIEYRTRDSIRLDSIYMRDSVFMKVKGDTVFLYKYKYLYRYRYLNSTDTVMKTDSVQVPYPVEKKLSKWQAFKMELGGWAMGILVLISIVVVRLMFRVRK